MSSMQAQLSELTELLKKVVVSKGEESGSTTEGAAIRGGEELATAAAAAAHGGASQSGSGRYDEYLSEPFRESGPQGRHSGEARGLNAPQVRVAAAHQEGSIGSIMGSGAAGFGVTAASGEYAYNNVRYTPNKFDWDSKHFEPWFNEFLMMANTANLLDQFVKGDPRVQR